MPASPSPCSCSLSVICPLFAVSMPLCVCACLFVCLCACLSVRLLFPCLSLWVFLSLPLPPFQMFFFRPLSIHFCNLYPSVYLSVFLSIYCLLVSPCVVLPLPLPVSDMSSGLRPNLHLSVRLPACLPLPPPRPPPGSSWHAISPCPPLPLSSLACCSTSLRHPCLCLRYTPRLCLYIRISCLFTSIPVAASAPASFIVAAATLVDASG